MSQPFRRLGLIPDVHCEDGYLAIAIKRLKREKVNALLCVGDLADGRGDLNRVCDLLRENDLLTVRGNHDRWLLDSEARDWPEAVQQETVEARTWEYLRSLPTSVPVETVAGKLLLCHGMGDNDWGRLEPGDYGYALEQNIDLLKILIQPEIAFVVVGHTHKPMVRRFARAAGQPLTVINVGQLKHRDGPVFVCADFESGDVQFYEIGEQGVAVGQKLNWQAILPEVWTSGVQRKI